MFANHLGYASEHLSAILNESFHSELDSCQKLILNDKYHISNISVTFTDRFISLGLKSPRGHFLKCLREIISMLQLQLIPLSMHCLIEYLYTDYDLDPV